MAYVLLNTKIGSHTIRLDEIRKIEGVQEAFNLWGIYDIIIRLKADTADKLTYIINEKLRGTDIHSKLILIITEPRPDKPHLTEKTILEPLLV
jgi:hypothetical protein